MEDREKEIEDRTKEIGAIAGKMQENRQRMWGILPGGVGGMGILLTVVAFTTNPLPPITLGLGLFFILIGFLLAIWIRWYLK